MLRPGSWLFGLSLVACGGRVADIPGSTNTGGVAALASGGEIASMGGTTESTVAPGGALAGGSTSNEAAPFVPISAEQYSDVLSEACNGWLVESESIPTSLQWIVDASHSMGEPAQPNTSKWNVTRQALQDAMLGISIEGNRSCLGVEQSLSIYQGTVPENLNASGAQPSDTCLGVMNSDPEGVASVQSMVKLLNATSVQGSTPTLDAYRYAVQHRQPNRYIGREFLVLVTDGSPTDCDHVPAQASSTVGLSNYNSDQWGVSADPIVAEIENARALGITTFVVGAPGSYSARPWLSRAADAGGTASANCNTAGDVSSGKPYCHIDMTVPETSIGDSIEQQLFSTAELASCSISIQTDLVSSGPLNALHASPVIRDENGQMWLIQVDQGPAERCNEGYRITGPSAIELCPAACELLRSDCRNSLTVLFPCEPGPISSPLI